MFGEVILQLSYEVEIGLDSVWASWLDDSREFKFLRLKDLGFLA